MENVDHWNNIATNVKNGFSYNGKYFKMTEDLSVTTMIGTDANHAFRGEFDGDGHTLTIDYTTDEDFCGPFCYSYGSFFALRRYGEREGWRTGPSAN